MVKRLRIFVGIVVLGAGGVGFLLLGHHGGPSPRFTSLPRESSPNVLHTSGPDDSYLVATDGMPIPGSIPLVNTSSLTQVQAREIADGLVRERAWIKDAEATDRFSLLAEVVPLTGIDPDLLSTMKNDQLVIWIAGAYPSTVSVVDMTGDMKAFAAGHSISLPATATTSLIVTVDCSAASPCGVQVGGKFLYPPATSGYRQLILGEVHLNEPGIGTYFRTEATVGCDSGAGASLCPR